VIQSCGPESALVHRWGRETRKRKRSSFGERAILPAYETAERRKKRGLGNQRGDQREVGGRLKREKRARLVSARVRKYDYFDLWT